MHALPPNSKLPQATASKWHAIRPWTAQLSLYTREITSVSATFILSTEPSVNGSEANISVARQAFSGHTHAEVQPEDAESGTGAGCPLILSSTSSSSSSSSSSVTTTTTTSKKAQSLLAEILSKGLEVKVNGVNWQRVLIRIDEHGAEAVIIVYGLMPGREYDIDLGIVQGGVGAAMRRQVLTFDHDNSDPDSTTEMFTDLDDHSNSSGSDPPQALSTPSTSPSRTIPSSPPSTPPPSHSHLSSNPTSQHSHSNSSTTSPTPIPPSTSLEDRLAQLQHQLTQLTNERDTLLHSLKSFRKDSQKADAHLRSEIESLKRASEKHQLSQTRSRQKILALQEAIKRAQQATREIEERSGEVEVEVEGLVGVKEEREREWQRVKGESERVGRVREEEEGRVRRRREGMRSELGALKNKLERLEGKRERLEGKRADSGSEKESDGKSRSEKKKAENVGEGGAIGELESKLGEVQGDIEEEERELARLERELEMFQDGHSRMMSFVGQLPPHQVPLQLQQISQMQTFPSQQQQQQQQMFDIRGRLGYLDHHSNYLTPQRTRHQSLNALQSVPSVSLASVQQQQQSPGPISRPSGPGPIQRPTFSSSPSASSSKSNSIGGTNTHTVSLSLGASSTGSGSIWGPVTSPARRESGGYAVGYLGQSQQQQQRQVPVILTNSNSSLGIKARRGSGSGSGSSASPTSPFAASPSSYEGEEGAYTKTVVSPPPGLRGPASSSSTLSSTSGSSLSLPLNGSTAATGTSSTSTLSSRAPAFEPSGRVLVGRGLGLGLGISTGSGPSSGSSHTVQSPTRATPSVGVIGAGRK